jgi:hypothetical protein
VVAAGRGSTADWAAAALSWLAVFVEGTFAVTARASRLSDGRVPVVFLSRLET